MAPSSNRPELSYRSNSAGELNAEECEFAAQLEDYLLRDSPETEHTGVELGDYTTATMILPPEPSDDLEGNIINIFPHLSAAESDVFADLVVQSSADNHHVEEAGLDFSSSRAGIDHWIRAPDMEKSFRRPQSSRTRKYSTADRTSTTKPKVGVRTAFGDCISLKGSPVEVDDIRREETWLEDLQVSFMNPCKKPKFDDIAQRTSPFAMDFLPNLAPPVNEPPVAIPLATWDPNASHEQESPRELYQWHDNSYSFSAAMNSPMVFESEEINRSPALVASCSGECSSSSGTSLVALLTDLEEDLVEINQEQKPALACDDVDADVQQRNSFENLAPHQQSPGIKRKLVEVAAVENSAPKYRGIVYNKNTGKWEAHVWDPSKQKQKNATERLRGKSKRVKAGVQIYLGQYHTCEEAASVHDKAAIKMGLTHDNNINPNIGSSSSRPSYALNFAAEAYEVEVLEYQDWSVRDYLWKLRKGGLGFSRGSSALKGVTWKKKVNKFEARYSLKDGGVKREFCLGLFDEEEMAGWHYDMAILFFKKEEAITNFKPSEYSQAEVDEYGRRLLKNKIRFS